DLVQFGQMILKVAGRSLPKSYGAYGCYCGWGGRGK
nr:RecName: Full=Phospholipase A2 neuwieditoxin-1; Short=NeuTX-1; Short=PLA2; AltName: Full=Neuwieditoxin-I; Short=NeuTX-I; AltName: Full=Phosphatidylcholine 2-acylhydrolase [Bothrops pauloensis]